MTDDICATAWAEVDASNNQTPPSGWPAGMLPNAVEPSARMNMGGVKRFWNRINPTYVTTAGATTDTYTVTPSQAINGYGLYEWWALRPHVSNQSTSPTLTISGFPATPIKKYVGSSVVAVAPFDIQPNRANKTYWDGTQFILDLPDVSYLPRKKITANYTTQMGDSVIVHGNEDTTSRTVTIAAYSSVPYRPLTALTIINDATAGIILITTATSDTLVFAGNAGTTGTRSLAPGGIATAVSMEQTRWMISGSGLT